MVLLGFTGFYWVLLGFLQLNGVLLGFIGFHWVLLGFTEFLPGFTWFYWILLGFTGFSSVELGFTGFSSFELGCTGFSPRCAIVFDLSALGIGPWISWICWIFLDFSVAGWPFFSYFSLPLLFFSFVNFFFIFSDFFSLTCNADVKARRKTTSAQKKIK